MKERYFKVTENVAKAVDAMDDKRAGELFKALCGYAFNGSVYDGKDVVIKSNFTLMKRVIDGQRENVANGKLGAKKSLELYKQKQQKAAEKQAAVGFGIVGGLGEFLSQLDEKEKK